MSNSDKEDKRLQQFDQLIADTYQVGPKIGSGTYGLIRIGINTHTNQKVAIKFENKKDDDPQLLMEYQAYQTLLNKGPIKGFPAVYHFGRYLDFQILVMELLGNIYWQ